MAYNGLASHVEKANTAATTLSLYAAAVNAETRKHALTNAIL